MIYTDSKRFTMFCTDLQWCKIVIYNDLRWFQPWKMATQLDWTIKEDHNLSRLSHQTWWFHCNNWGVDADQMLHELVLSFFFLFSRLWLPNKALKQAIIYRNPGPGVGHAFLWEELFEETSQIGIVWAIFKPQGLRMATNGWGNFTT